MAKARNREADTVRSSTELGRVPPLLAIRRDQPRRTDPGRGRVYGKGLRPTAPGVSVADCGRLARQHEVGELLSAVTLQPTDVAEFADHSAATFGSGRAGCPRSPRSGASGRDYSRSIGRWRTGVTCSTVPRHACNPRRFVAFLREHKRCSRLDTQWSATTSRTALVLCESACSRICS